MLGNFPDRSLEHLCPEQVGNEGVPGFIGIEAECGGALSCGTCHVYLTAPASAVLPAPSEAESSMLEVVAAERRSDSRLACQIVITPDLSGLFVEIPATQF